MNSSLFEVWTTQVLVKYKFRSQCYSQAAACLLQAAAEDIALSVWIRLRLAFSRHASVVIFRRYSATVPVVFDIFVPPKTM